MCSRKCETPLIFGVFVARAGLDEQPGGEGMRIGIDLGDDVEAVGELMVVERSVAYRMDSRFRGTILCATADVSKTAGEIAAAAVASLGETGRQSCDIVLIVRANAVWRQLTCCRCAAICCAVLAER